LFKTPDQAPDSIYAPDNKHCSCCASTDAGCTDLTWLDLKRLAFASDNGIIEIWSTGESFNEVDILANLTGHDDIVQSISVNCDRVKIVSGSLDMRLVKCDDDDGGDDDGGDDGCDDDDDVHLMMVVMMMVMMMVVTMMMVVMMMVVTMMMVTMVVVMMMVVMMMTFI
jgi:uncharacterized protein (DUF983 family)